MAQTIDREIRQTKPFGSLQEQVVINLLRTTRAVEESWTQHLKRTEGISPSQYNILRILRGARPKAAKISEIADRMVTRDPDVTRLVDRLIKQGLARRERDGEDRRPRAAGAPRWSSWGVHRSRDGRAEAAAAQNPGYALERGQGRHSAVPLTLWVDICFHGYPHHKERNGFFAADVDPELTA